MDQENTIEKIKKRLSEIEEVNSIILECLNSTICYFETLLLQNPNLEKDIYPGGEMPTIVLQNLKFKLLAWI